MKLTDILIFFLSVTMYAQKPLSKVLEELNNESVPYITVDGLKSITSTYVLLDTREPREFKVSHIENAICVGYDYFNLKNTLKQLPKDKTKPIVVYCSLGVRSEDIGEKLQKEGYTNVVNLYGGIFEWKNQGNEVVTFKKKPTEKIHTFNKEWSKWLKKGKKVYD